MARRLKLCIPLLVFGLIVMIFWVGLGKDPNLLPSALIGQPVPFQEVPTLDGSMLSKDAFVGKVSLINVWATWCSQCSIEQPLLIDLTKQHDLQLIGLNYKDQQQAAKKFLEQTGNPYKQVIFDPSGQFAMSLGVYGTPETFLIDKKGHIRHRYIGVLTLALIEKDLLLRIKQLQSEN